MKYLNDELALHLRQKSIDVENRKLLVTNFIGSDQEQDLSKAPNCKGFGRIRHFKKETSSGWPDNPLPIAPASKSLGLEQIDKIEAQAFQNSACNWRCWYCFVPFNLLSANSRFSDWKTPKELIELYLKEENKPEVIDLTGGQPDLVPEWVPWTMEVLKDKGIDDSVYLWSDDNLSNDFFWEYLSDNQIELVSSYKNYGRVTCFKGYNPDSFSFNTNSSPKNFDKQFDLFKRLLDLGIDIYCYATFTSPKIDDIEIDLPKFIDRLQHINEFLPLRTVPLEIQIFSPMKSRINNEMERSIQNQWKVIEIWKKELARRFTSKQLSTSITDVDLF